MSLGVTVGWYVEEGRRSNHVQDFLRGIKTSRVVSLMQGFGVDQLLQENKQKLVVLSLHEPR